MNLLLDTHVWIWSQELPENLGVQARSALVDRENSLFVSTLSSLEMARLLALSRLRLGMNLQAWVKESLRLLQATTVILSHEIAMEAYALPEPFHRDPADRVLVATARVHGFHLITADEQILRYPHAESLDART